MVASSKFWLAISLHSSLASTFTWVQLYEIPMKSKIIKAAGQALQEITVPKHLFRSSIRNCRHFSCNVWGVGPKPNISMEAWKGKKVLCPKFSSMYSLRKHCLRLQARGIPGAWENQTLGKCAFLCGRPCAGRRSWSVTHSAHSSLSCLMVETNSQEGP